MIQTTDIYFYYRITLSDDSTKIIPARHITEATEQAQFKFCRPPSNSTLTKIELIRDIDDDYPPF